MSSTISNNDLPGSVELNADTLYRLLPDFTKWNNRFSLDDACKIVIVPLIAFIANNLVTKNPHSLLNRVCLGVTIGTLATKGALSVCAYIHNKIWKSTEEYAKKESIQASWGLLLPPTNPAITDAWDRCYTSTEALVSNSFPDESFVYRYEISLYVVPKPKPYTLDQLESECEKWMQDSLAIAQAVREDLKKWSDEKRFTKKDGSPITGGTLLQMQSGWRRELHTAPWLYRGFFSLPTAYRMIFNLSDPVAAISNLPEYWKNLEFARDFVKAYPEQNRELLNGWKEKFFTPGTKQYQWREQFNAEMGKIAEQLGGLTTENVTDKRFVTWGQQHLDNNLNFVRTPDTRPT